MGLFDFLKGPSPEQIATAKLSEARQQDILTSLRHGRVPSFAYKRLGEAMQGKTPWMATLTPAELSIARSHGLKPIATVTSTCWLHYGWSWTLGHAEGWNTALRRLGDEALACGANAVLDVKMRTIPLGGEHSMDFSLIGTAVRVDGLPPSSAPVIATVPALEFVKLLEADVVPTGIAVGADYQWMRDWWGNASGTGNWFNNESAQLTRFWQEVRKNAHANLRQNALHYGNGVLAHQSFSQMFEFERKQGEQEYKEYLARHIIIATTVDARKGTSLPHEFKMVVDMHAGKTPLVGTKDHHQSYATNEESGAI